MLYDTNKVRTCLSTIIKTTVSGCSFFFLRRTMQLMYNSTGNHTNINPKTGNKNCHVSSILSSASSLSKSTSSSSSSIMYYWKYASPVLMIGAFVFATIILPQQRRLLQIIVLDGQQDEQYHKQANQVLSMALHSTATDITTTNTKDNNIVFVTNSTAATAVALQPKDNFSGIMARPFLSWPVGTLLPCYPPSKDWDDMKVQFTPTNRGFLYVKPYKTGSSTTSGVHLRIARNVAKRRKKMNITICESRFDHGPDFHPGHTLYRNRIRDESFLWSVLRHPSKRAISQFFHFKVSRRKIEPTDANLINYLRNSDLNMMQDYYYRALYTKRRFDRKSNNPINAANHILRTYNFIGITERLDESFVVLMMILQLKIADILYLSAKTKGGYDDAGGRGRICTYIWPSFVTPKVDEFLNSKEWRNMTRYDMLLYEAVNRSMDLTIDSLGRDKFNENLQKYQHAQQIAHEKCTPTAVFPCDTGGNYHDVTDCIWNDSGCGATCLDDVATELNLW